MTLAELRQLFEQRRQDAERAGYLAPVASVYAAVLADLKDLSTISGKNGGRVLDVKQAAARLGMSEGWTYDHSGEIGAVRYGRAIRFPVEVVEEYRERHNR